MPAASFSAALVKRLCGVSGLVKGAGFGALMEPPLVSSIPGDDSDIDGVTHVFVDGSSKDDGGIRINGTVMILLASLTSIMIEVRAARDVKEHPFGNSKWYCQAAGF